MNTSLRHLRGTTRPGARLGGRSAAGSVIRVRLLTVVTITLLGLVSVSAQTTVKLSDGFVNEPYTTFSFADAVKGEGAGAQWALTSGAWPSGLVLSPEGVLSGTPTTAQTFKFEVQAKVGGSETFKTKVVLRVRSAGFDAAQVNSAGASVTSVDAAPAPPICQPPASSFVLASSTAEEETIGLTEDANPATLAALDPNTLAILNADQLIQNTLGNTPAGTAPFVFKKGDYIIIRILKWGAVKDPGKADPDKKLDALYELVGAGAGGTLKWEARMNPDDRENFDTRIFGSRRVAVLVLHLQTPRTWDIKYKVNINQRIPQPIQNVLQLAAFVGGAGTTDNECVPSPIRNIWGGRMLLVRYRASDMVVKLNTVTANEDGRLISQSKEDSKQYLNEGRYHWDVSVGMPVKSIKQLEFSSENGIVTAKKKEKQNAYAFLNLFPLAVDLNGKSYLTSPHFVIGVPISGKPLDRPIVGVGTGLYTKQFKMNFFAGIVFNKVREPRTLGAGQAATTGQLESDLQTRRVRKFVFGINFPVRQFIEAVKAAK